MGILNFANYHFELLDYYFWSSLINAIVAFVAGVVVLNRHPAGRKNIAFFLFALSVFAWALPYSIWQLAATEQVALFWTRALMFGAVFVTVALLHFTLETLEIYSTKHRLVELVFFLLFVFFAFADLTPLFVSHVKPALSFPFWPQPGPLFHPYLILWMLCLGYASVLMFLGYRRASDEKRQQLKLMTIGFVVAILSGSTNYFLWYGIPVVPFANIFSSMFVVMIAYAMLRYRLFEIPLSVAAAAVIDALADPLLIINTEYRISMANEATAQMVDLPMESLKGKKISTFLPCAHNLIGQLLDSEQQNHGSISGDEIFLRTGGGKRVSISLSVSRIPIKNKFGFVFICHSIADLKEQLELISQQRLDLAMKSEQLEKTNVELSASRESVVRALEEVQQEKVVAERERERSETILRDIGDGVFVVGRNGKLIMVNPALERLVGRGNKRITGRPYLDYLNLRHETDGTAIVDFVAESMLSDRITHAPRGTVLLINDGREIPVAVSSSPLTDKQGGVFGAVAVLRDETKEREIDRAKSEFISLASHQMRTPLSSMKWLLEMLETTDQGGLTEQQREYVALLKRSSARMTKLVNELLNTYQIENGEIRLNPHEIDLDALCRLVVDEIRPTAATKNLQLTIQSGQLGNVYADSNLVYNALLNLLTNAVTYTPEGGQIELGGDRSDQEAVIYVKDTGIGVPKHQQDKIFRKFFRGDNVILMDTEGAGLGLYVVKSIIESSGGRVWLESEEGHGSKFYISLPVGGLAKQDTPTSKDV